MIVAMQDTDGNRYIWDELLRQWVPVTGAMSPAELAAEMAPTLRSQFGLVVDVVSGDNAAAINAALSSGATDVSLPHGQTVGVGSTIVVPTGVRFDLNKSTLKPLADVDVVQVSEDSTVCNGVIDCQDLSGYSANAVALYGTTTFGSPLVLTKVADLRISGTVAVDSTGTGIALITGTAPSNRVSFVHVTDVHIDGFEYGVRMHAQTPTSGSVWIVGTTWTGLHISRSRRLITFLSEGGQQIAGHQMTGVQAQTNATIVAGITATGMVFRNRISMAMYDWSLVDPSVVFDSSTFWNVVETDEPRSRISDAGNANSFICRAEVVLPPSQSAPAIHLPGSAGEYITTPDHADLDITDNLELVMHVALADWTPASSPNLIAKRQTTGQFSWQFSVNTAGTLRLIGTADGSTLGDANSTVAPSVSDGAFLWLRVTFAAGAVNFYTHVDQNTEPSAAAWTQLGSTRTMTSSITALFSSTSQVELGSTLAGTAGNLNGRIRRAIIRSGGVVAADYRASAATRWRDSTGKIWTANGSAWALS